MKTDYQNEIAQLLVDWYEPIQELKDKTDKTLHKTLTDIHLEIINVLPAQWVLESDVYKILTENGFKPFRFSYVPEGETENSIKFKTAFLLNSKIEY